MAGDSHHHPFEFEPANVMALVSERRGISARVNRFIHELKL
ncbi:MAG: hypothetical protein PS018_04370 [bacterium]|nr:hypothetical protein [bacterium]